MGRTRITSIALVLAAAVAYAQGGRNQDMWIGTWTLNPAKSKLQASPAPRSSLHIEVVPDGMRVITDGVSPAGVISHTEYTARYDGSEVPVIGAPPDSTAAVTRIDAYTFDLVVRSQGATTYVHNEVSRDGKTLTSTQKLVIGSRESSIVRIYDKER